MLLFVGFDNIVTARLLVASMFWFEFEFFESLGEEMSSFVLDHV